MNLRKALLERYREHEKAANAPTFTAKTKAAPVALKNPTTNTRQKELSK